VGTPNRTFELAKVGGRGIAVASSNAHLFSELYKLLWGLDVVTASARKRIEEALARGDSVAAASILLNPRAFRRRYVWAVFWSITEASLEVAAVGLGKSHEPELNGAYVGFIRKAISSFAPARQDSLVAVVIGDHATLGNEARSGADFGLIIEIEDAGVCRHLVTLLQAKKATTRMTDIRRAAGESTQLDRLVSSGIGSFLFYHAHNDPPGLGPTVKDAHAILMSNPARVDTVWGATDFAARVAAAIDRLSSHASPPYALPGFGLARGRDDALRLLFNPNVQGIKVNDVLVARVGDGGLPPQAVADFENDWRQRVDQHRGELARSRGETRWQRGQEKPPTVEQW
jgi:hypothetical protein